MSGDTQQNGNDLNADANLKRIDDLETFRKEFEGENFYQKICTSIDKSRDVETALKKVIWDTIKGKLNWIILTGASLIVTDLIIRVIPHILASLK